METSVLVTRFGPFELRPGSRELYKFGTKVKLRPQPFQVLHLLLNNAGHVVTREQLQQQLWPSDTFVDFEHSLNTAIKELRAVLNDSAAEPRYIETIPRLGYRFIFPVDPCPPEVQTSLAAPVDLPQPIPLQTLPAAPVPGILARLGPPTRRWVGLSLGAALLLLAAGIAVAGMGVFRRSPGAGAFKARPSIAVLGFRNMSHKAEQDWMSTAMAEMLDAELASGQQIRVIPAENVARMNLDLSLPPADTYGRETLDKIHNHLGADMVVSGSYLALAEGSTTKLRIVLQVQDTRTGETIVSFTEDGTQGDLPQLVSAGGDNLRRTLGIGPLSAIAAREVRASAPSNSEAERLYAEGLARLQGFDPLTARTLLEKAVAADPNHALSYSALAECLSLLGYDLKSQDEARKAFDLSANLSREDRLSIEGRYRELIHDQPAALEIYRTLHSFFPDNLDYSLRFARAQIQINPADALQTVATLRRLPEPEGKDARIDLVEASAAERLGDMARSQKAAAASAARAQALGSGLMLASALDGEAWAWVNLGEPDKAIAADTRARELWLAAGDARNAAKALHGIAFDQRDKGTLSEAQTSFEQALKEFQRIGANWDSASCSHNLALLLLEQGQLEPAREHLEEALRIQRGLNDKRGISFDLNGLGGVALRAGQLSAAKEMKEKALEGLREVGDKRGESIVLRSLGEVLYQQGQLAAATENYSQAVALQKTISYKTGLAGSLAGLAEILTAQDRLDEAFSSAQQSLALRQQNREGNHSAESNVQLAEIALHQGKPAAAESLARSAASVLDGNQSPASASLAYSVLARSLVAEGKLNAARAAAERAATLAQQGGDRMVRIQAGLAQAEVDILSGRSADAERNLNVLHDQANHEGYAAFELRSRFLLAKAELRSGKRAAARARFDKLQSDARSKGFLLIARQASASLPRV